MAGWALGLAIVPCCGGVTTLVGIGLGIAVLVRSRGGRDVGKGLGIAAIVVGCAWIVVGIVAVVLGVVDDLTSDAERDDRGSVVERSEQSITKLRPGDCFDYPEGADIEDDAVATVTAVPCDQRHQLEAYHVFDLRDGRYPGDDEVDRLASEGCLSAFRDYVGIPYAKSELEPYTFSPRAVAWRALGDREVTCFLGQPDTTITGSARGSRR